MDAQIKFRVKEGFFVNGIIQETNYGRTFFIPTGDVLTQLDDGSFMRPVKIDGKQVHFVFTLNKVQINALMTRLE